MARRFCFSFSNPICISNKTKVDFLPIMVNYQNRMIAGSFRKKSTRIMWIPYLNENKIEIVEFQCWIYKSVLFPQLVSVKFSRFYGICQKLLELPGNAALTGGAYWTFEVFTCVTIVLCASLQLSIFNLDLFIVWNKSQDFSRLFCASVRMENKSQMAYQLFVFQNYLCLLNWRVFVVDLK